MPESSVSPMSRAQEESPWESSSGSDLDFAAEKEAETAELMYAQVPPEQSLQDALVVHKAMQVTYGDPPQSHVFRWDLRMPPDAFLRQVKKHFQIPSAIHVKWKDDTGAFVVFDDSMPSGSYIIQTSGRQVQLEDLVNESRERKVAPKKFGQALLAIKQADCYITCERAWLGWVRAVLQLGNMMLVFFLRVWWAKPTVDFERGVILVGASIALAHAACFAVGYYRYSNWIKLIQDTSNYQITDLPDRGGPAVWLERVYILLGLVLAAAGTMLLFPFFDRNVSSLPFFS